MYLRARACVYLFLHIVFVCVRPSHFVCVCVCVCVFVGFTYCDDIFCNCFLCNLCVVEYFCLCVLWMYVFARARACVCLYVLDFC